MQAEQISPVESVLISLKILQTSQLVTIWWATPFLLSNYTNLKDFWLPTLTMDQFQTYLYITICFIAIISAAQKYPQMVSLICVKTLSSIIQNMEVELEMGRMEILSAILISEEKKTR